MRNKLCNTHRKGYCARLYTGCHLRWVHAIVENNKKWQYNQINILSHWQWHGTIGRLYEMRHLQCRQTVISHTAGFPYALGQIYKIYDMQGAYPIPDCHIRWSWCVYIVTYTYIREAQCLSYSHILVYYLDGFQHETITTIPCPLYSLPTLATILRQNILHTALRSPFL